MPAPTTIRSTAGFRYAAIYELTTSGSWLGLPLGAVTRQAETIYVISSGSLISGSGTVAIPVGVTVSGSVPYYGALITGSRTLQITDPQPRVIPHIGEDGVFALQVLPPLEPVTGELQTDKTNDVVDAIVSNVKSFQIGEAKMLGQATNKRGFELTVGVLAYSAAEDTDPDSPTFGTNTWDFRVMPKAILFTRDTGYGQEANLRTYSVSPMYVTAHLWGVQYTVAVEGFIRAQVERGVSQYKPEIVGYKGDGATLAFPFDSSSPPVSTSKIVVWKNGVLLAAGFSVSVNGISFAVAPLVTDVITAFYEAA